MTVFMIIYLMITTCLNGNTFVVDAAITSRPQDLEECIYTSFTINWDYSDKSDLSRVEWKRSSSLVVVQNAPGAPQVQPGYDTFRYISDGKIENLNASWSDNTTFSVDVSYSLSSGLSSDTDSVFVYILDPPIKPKAVCSGPSLSGSCTCSTLYAGSPAVDVFIKVGSDPKVGPTSTVETKEDAYCCVRGDAVKCMANALGNTELCWKFREGLTTATTSTTSTSTTSSTATSTTTTTTSTSMTPNSTPLPATTRAVTSESRYSPTFTYAATSTASSKASDSVSSTSMTLTSTAETLSKKYGQDLIIMIIVVSVIGGVLVLAILTLVFFWVHWKKCLFRKGHLKHSSLSSDLTKKGRQYQRRYKTSTEYSTAQKENAMKDYSLYKGKLNPVYDGTMVANNYYPNKGTFPYPEYTDKLEQSAYQYGYNWKQRDSF